jgi:hypothetical protein
MPGASRTTCPHCRAPLSRLDLGEVSSDHGFDLVCFNDDCPYYARGWIWMEQQYGVRASYRCRIDVQNGHESPIPVWSPSALRDLILPDEPSQDSGPKERP